MGFTQKIKASEKSDALIRLQVSAADNRFIYDIIIGNFPITQKLIPDSRVKYFLPIA